MSLISKQTLIKKNTLLLISILIVSVAFTFGNESPIRFGRVLVVANKNSSASVELANKYSRSRALPPANLLFLPFSDSINLKENEFYQKLLSPVLERIKKLNNSIDFVTLIAGVPYRTEKLSTATALFFSGINQIKDYHGYYSKSYTFESSIPVNKKFYLPTTLLMGYNLKDTIALIENSKIHSGFSQQDSIFYLCHGEGPRGVRNKFLPRAKSILTDLGFNTKIVSNSDIKNTNNIIFQITGKKWVHLSSNNYLPGSIIDNMTSTGGYLLEKSGQNSILSFIQHGACGAYGTVTEPTNILSRWPDLSLPIRYASGFNLIESYLQSVQDWKYGIVVGDPLTARFSTPCKVTSKIKKGSPKNDGIKLEFNAKEGEVGKGFSWIEIWLNDQEKLKSIVPLIPENTTINLIVRHGYNVIENITYTSTKGEQISNILGKFRDLKNSNFKISIVGKRKNKLLIQVDMNRFKTNKIPFVATMTLQNGKKKYTYAERLKTQLKQSSVNSSSEIILQPNWPISVIKESLEISKEKFWRGYNEIRISAGNHTESESHSVEIISIGDALRENTFKIENSNLSLNDSLKLYFVEYGNVADSFKHIYINEKPVFVCDPNIYSCNIPLAQTIISTGENQIWVEWYQSGSIHSEFEKRSPIYKSAPKKIFVRRPLISEAEFQPKIINEGTNASIEVRGPYLHENIYFSINGKKVKSIRDVKFGMNWNVNLGHLKPGSYEIIAVGNPDFEDSDAFSDKLIIR